MYANQFDNPIIESIKAGFPQARADGDGPRSPQPEARSPDLESPGPALQGPLGVRTQGVLRELFLDPILLDARPLERVEIDLRWAAANSWSTPTHLLAANDLDEAQLRTDEQADSLTMRVRAPWSRWLDGGPILPGSSRPLWARLGTAVEWRLTEHWGGWSDGAIGGFHHLIGGFDYERDKYAANTVALFLGNLNGGPVAFDLRSSTFAWGDLVLRNQALLAEGPWGALGARLDLKAPTGALARAGSSGGFDGMFGIAGTALLAPAWTLHAMAALSIYSDFAAPILLQPERAHGSFEASLEWNLGAVELLLEDRLLTQLLHGGWTWLQFGGSDGFISSAWAASFRAHNQITLGARFRDFSFWLSEDYTPGSNPRSVIRWVYVSNSPDIVAGLSWTHRI